MSAALSSTILESRAVDILLYTIGPEAPLRGVVLAIATLIVFLHVYKATRRSLESYIRARRAFKAENADTFLKIYDMGWKGLIAILVITAATGSFRLLGLSIGFFGTMLGWSLQTPIRGMAAWVMVMLKKPFRIGERITVAGVTGDVTDIQLNHIILNQVGGTVQGEDKSGRGILVPTAMLFAENIINYNYFKDESLTRDKKSRFMLDEVLARITFSSDFEYARELCVGAAKKALNELVGDTGEEPFTRAEFMAWGVLMRVRYQTIPAKRQEVSSRVSELIWEAFNANSERVYFSYPASITHFTLEDASEEPPFIEPAEA